MYALFKLAGRSYYDEIIGMSESIECHTWKAPGTGKQVDHSSRKCAILYLKEDDTNAARLALCYNLFLVLMVKGK